MIIAGHQPNYLAYPGFFHKMLRADAFVLVDHVQFVKRGPFGWIHRNRIRSRDGWDWLTVPVLTSGRFHQPIREVEIRRDQPWRRKHWRAIEFAYRGAPHFGWVAERLRPVYAEDWARLADLNVRLIRLLREMLDIATPLHVSSEAGITSGAPDLVRDLCRRFGSATYLCGVHGKDYLDEAWLASEGIRVLYQDYVPAPYDQGSGPFVPDLSVVDLLFRLGPDARRFLEARP